jgi:hypothetical protein
MTKVTSLSRQLIKSKIGEKYDLYRIGKEN